MSTSIAPRIYLRNKDILVEIHKSKNTFCYYTQPEYADYDLILPNIVAIPAALLPTTITHVTESGVEKITNLLSTATAARAKRLSIDESDVKLTDIIFRITSWDHIPFAPIKIRKRDMPKKSKFVEIDEDADIIETEYDEPVPDIAPPTANAGMKYVKLNFPPFLHYKFNDAGELVVVGKSHWKGDLVTGEFCREHGKPTNTLALMWMKLCERYATKSNWRGYSYNDEMECQALMQLCNVGLQFDESKSLNPFAYYTAALTNSFTRVLNTERKHRDIRDDLMEIASLNPSFTRQNSNDTGGDD